MRTMHDAILIGIGTALNDNPQLNSTFKSYQTFQILMANQPDICLFAPPTRRDTIYLVQLFSMRTYGYILNANSS
jgi:hypothetical protein